MRVTRNLASFKYAAIFLVVCPQAAVGHAVPSAPLTPQNVWSAWNADPWLVGAIVAILALYACGVMRLWERAGRGRGIPVARAAAFLTGAIALFVALISPLDALGETLLSAHMVQHGLLIAVAPPLILWGLPGAAFAWVLPAAWRRALARRLFLRTLSRCLAWTLYPLAAATIHGVTVWFWHAPAMFDAALARPWLHTLEHATFLVTALLFWQSLILSSRCVATAASAVGAAFATMLHGGFLGALITFAPNALYAWYAERTSPWGLTPLEDQQLAGLLMWVPIGLVYFAVSLLLAALFVIPTRPTPVNEGS